jgi:ubiquinone/menaquinone biosynthesis C-methylase UbiE
MKAAEIARLRRVYDGRQAPEVAWRYASSRPGVRYLRLRRDRAIRRLLARRGIADLSALRILDLGCGRGMELAEWRRRGGVPHGLAGVDLMEQFARQAHRAVPDAAVAVASADELPFADATFDIVEQSMLFSSILDDSMRALVAAEALRVVKPGGFLLWYDFRVGNPRNADLRPVPLAEIARLFPGCPIDLRRVTLLPPLARTLGILAFSLGRALETLPSLRTHYLGTIQRP